MWKSCFAAIALLVLALPARAAEPVIPNFWDYRERIAMPRIEGMQRLRFLTTIDFPPFNYLDDQGKLVGFHVDLATAICEQLALTGRCQIQALPWRELEPALQQGDGEAILAGLAITAESRGRLAFTRPYLKLPARFVVPVDVEPESATAPGLAGRRVGVLAGSAHEAMLRDYFPAVQAVTYDQANWMYADLRQGKLGAIFGDGMQLSFWLGSVTSGNCCQFAGGPYLSDEHLGLGLAIATLPDQPALAEALNYALREIQTKGKFAEIYLRYFPIGFY